MIRHVLVLTFLGVVAGAGIMTARGYYCRDPDTGKLYPVNASWPSSSFCGSYTCRLRKRNMTDTKYKPWRQLNITQDINKNITIISSKIEGQIKPGSTPCTKSLKHVEFVSPNNEVTTTESIIDLKIENRTKGDILELIHKKIDKNKFIMNVIKGTQNLQTDFTNNNIDSDRYLTGDEIKVLVDILHSIKKSDLIALVEMYNLAQNVYNELDASPSETVADETINDLKSIHEKFRDNEPVGKKKPSYWYEPLAVPVSKHKGELDVTKDNVLSSIEEVSPVVIKKNQANTDISNTNSITFPPKIINQIKPNKDLNTYLGDTLSKEDFRKLPYFYPISTFQRISSYMHPNKKSIQTKVPNPTQEEKAQQLFTSDIVQSLLAKNAQTSTVQQTARTPSLPLTQNLLPKLTIPNLTMPQTKILTNLLQQPVAKNAAKTIQLKDSDTNMLNGYKPHCKHEASHLQYLHAHPSWFNRIVKKPFSVDNKNHLLDPVSLYIPEKEKTIAHLPYPLNYLNKMNITLQKPKVNGPWAVLDFMKTKKGAPSYVSAAYIAHLPNTILINPVVEESKEAPHKLRSKKLVGDSREYEMGAIAQSVLEDNDNPLRKKVRLEKIDKLLRLDSLMRLKRDAKSAENKKGETRSKDSSESIEEFELYLDRSTCDADTNPGFFRMGNLTEPFPACCPQRIGSKR